MHLSKEVAKYFAEDIDDVRKIHEDITNQLEDLFDEIVKKEYSKELKKKILKDQLEFYEKWIRESKEWLKKFEQDKNERAMERKKESIQELEKDCESIRHGRKIDNKQFASAFISKKEGELWSRHLNEHS